jgi:hypothetical protein
MTKLNDGRNIRSRPIKGLILWLDAILARLWKSVIYHKDVFIHGDFTFWGFIKNNVHMFLVLGLFGAIMGYLNTFIEREVPFNVYAGKLGVRQMPFSMLQAAFYGQNPLSSPFPPADLIFGITTSMVMFILIAMSILWGAITYREKELAPHMSSEFCLIMRISFVTLFGSMMLVFLSYLIRNYGLLFIAVLELFSAFVAIYVISFVFKRTKDPWPWLLVFILLGTATYALKAYIPVVSIFFLSLGIISLAVAVLAVPFLLIKIVITHLKERHLG